MVCLSRPENAACTVRSGISPGYRPVIACLQQCVASLAAIIDGLHPRAMPRNALLHVFLSFCPTLSLWTRLCRLYLLWSCARAFALAKHSLQNQDVGLPRPRGALCAELEPRHTAS